MTDAEFVEAFESCRLPNELFHHRDHLRLARIYIQRYGQTEATARIGESIRRYAAYHGKFDKYHETVTVAWLRLVAESMLQAPGASFDELLAASPELLQKETLYEYYSPELLGTDTARAGFVCPDRKPLPGSDSRANATLNER